MSGKERRKYHGIHRIHQQPRNLARYFREGFEGNDQAGLRRQRSAYRGTR
jgi:hypothetical protein